MNDKNIKELTNTWLEIKELEKSYTAKRREVEDQIKDFYGVDESLSKTETFEIGNIQIKITGRVDRKIDGELLQDIAVEHGLNGFLSELFRWKPEINMKAWKAADSSITGPLSGAITTKPGRPSFSITTKT